MEKLNLLLVGGMGSIGQHLSKNLPKTCSLLIMDKKKLKKNPNNYIQCELEDIENLKNIVNNVPNNLIVVYLAGNLSNEFFWDRRDRWFLR